MNGFLQYQTHNLLIAKVADLQQQKQGDKQKLQQLQQK